MWWCFDNIKHANQVTPTYFSLSIETEKSMSASFNEIDNYTFSNK